MDIYTTKADVVGYIAESIESAGAATVDECGVDAIADECFTYTYTRNLARNGYRQTASADEFWASVARNAR